MRKLVSLLFLMILIGCGETESIDSSQPNGSNPEQNEVSQETLVTGMENKQTDEISSPPIIKNGQHGVIPETIIIESIGVKAPVEKVGLTEKGKMEVPKDYKNVGWYQGGSEPGERGSSVMAGHVNYSNDEGVFWDLNKLKSGDEVKIVGKNGETLAFEVIRKKSFQTGNAPVKKVFGYTSRRTLNLITCTGDFNYEIGTHEQRLVVFTELKTDASM